MHKFLIALIGQELEALEFVHVSGALQVGIDRVVVQEGVHPRRQNKVPVRGAGNG